jgi:hypothetical protein
MGAALTYARRYALFTLVGIAGAPDLAAPTNRISESERPRQSGTGRPNGGQHGSAQHPALRPQSRALSQSKAELEPEASAELRDKLIADLNDLKACNDAALWAHRNLGEKNKLTAPDARRVEEQFQTKLETLPTPVNQTMQLAPHKNATTKPNERPRPSD